MEWMSIAHLWQAAELPGDLFARVPRDSVLRAITVAMCSLIGGPRWARREFEVENEQANALGDLQNALGNAEWQRVIAKEVVRSAPGYSGLPLDDRVGEFADVVRRTMPYESRGSVESDWLAEYLLRLASSPGSVAEWSGERCRVGVDIALQASLMFRAARYIVILVHLDTPAGAGASPYRGWHWQ